MRKFWRKNPFVLYHIDRIDSSYGNIMVRGWAVNCRKELPLTIRVKDAKGADLPVYMERLVRADVNAALGQDADLESGMHILLDRAVLDTPYVWLTFENGRQSRRVKIKIHAGNALERFIQTKAKKTIPGQEPDYDLWVRAQEPDFRGKRAQRQRKFPYAPVFSVVVPLYNTPRIFLKEIIDSVLNQTYGKVELCLADGSTDDRAEQYIRRHYAKRKGIRYCRLKKNRGISENTNVALKAARGDFIVFADHDDVLAPDAFFWLAEALNWYPDADLLYSDEDKINRKGNAYFGPHFKPDFSMELLCCNNYICHLLAVRRDLREKVGLLNPEYDGAQDYDYVLRCAEMAKQIIHIPRVLYHWRTHPASTAGNPDSKAYAFEAGRRAVEAHYRRLGIAAAVENTPMLGRYRTRFAIQGEPLVTILIPNKDHVEDLKRCLTSLRDKTTYRNYEILIVENNSVLPETEQFYRTADKLFRSAGQTSQKDGAVSGSAGAAEHEKRRAKQPGDDSSARYGSASTPDSVSGEPLPARTVRVIRWGGSFNYAAIHNFAVPQARGEYVVLLNNDTEVISPGWLEEMLGLCQKPDAGAVGAKLYYPDGTIQHAGVILGMCGVASHIYVGFPGDREGYAARLVSVQDLSAVTGACMMTKKSAWEKAGGMEERLAVAYNDIDYCLRLRSAGMRVLFTPYAELTHYESKTRGLEDTQEKRERLRREAAFFESKWKDILAAGDPFYNPNLSLTRTDCALRETGAPA